MSTLLPGTQVEARGLPWEVVHAEPAGEQQRFRLRCLQGDLQGMEVDLLHPFEPIRPIATDFDPQRAGRLRQWRLYHDAFLLEQALGPSALLAVQPGRIDIAPYQLVPVMRALRMSRPRLLLADGVGLGKTIEAGLVMAELIARRRAHRILIVSPAGPLLEQWHGEMRDRRPPGHRGDRGPRRGKASGRRGADGLRLQRARGRRRRSSGATSSRLTTSADTCNNRRPLRWPCSGCATMGRGPRVKMKLTGVEGERFMVLSEELRDLEVPAEAHWAGEPRGADTWTQSSL